MMLDDGINEAPTPAVSNMSASFSESTDLANMSSDFIFMRSKLNLLIDLIRIAKNTKSIIKQNYFWALTYNCPAVPLAMMGLVPPRIVAIGMSVSSLIVVANTLRLKNYQPVS
jgi:Cu2+-exporting ATPase